MNDFYSRIEPDLTQVPTAYLLKEIARRSTSAVLSINWRTPGDSVTQSYSHGKRCEVIGLIEMARDAVGDDPVGRLVNQPFPNPPHIINAIQVVENNRLN